MITATTTTVFRADIYIVILNNCPTTALIEKTKLKPCLTDVRKTWENKAE